MPLNSSSSTRNGLEILHGRSGFARLAPAWRQLVESQTQASPFQHPEWIGAWLESICTEPEQLRLLALRHHGELVAVLPLVPHACPLARLLPQWTMIQGPHMVLTELAGSPARWPSLLQALATQRALRCSALQLPSTIHELTPAAEALPAGSTMRRMHRSESAWLDCSGDTEQALVRVQRSFRQNVRRLGRRADSQGQVTLEVADTPATLEDALTHFLDIEASGWKGRSGSAIRDDVRLVGFYRALVRDFGARGQCRIHRLTLDGRTIAAQFALLGGRQLNLLKIGYDETFAAIAPGHLLMMRIIERTCADPALDRLSLVTNPPWAHLWKPELAEVDHLTLTAPDWSGRLLGRLMLWRDRRRHTAAPAPAPASPDSSRLPTQFGGT
ncbi:MAG: hypothetical protein RL654_1191 [Pseudomonadota bacterium]